MFQILFSSREFTKLKKTSNNEKTYDHENKNTTTSWSWFFQNDQFALGNLTPDPT